MIKILFLILLFFLIFWYYRKRRFRRIAKSKALEVEMRACRNCGIFFPLQYPHNMNKDSERNFFCSDQCYKEFQMKSKES